MNLHLLGAHVSSGGYVLPDHAVLVLDEARDAVDIMAAALGVTLTPGRVAAVARLADTARLGRHRDSVDRALSPLVGNRLATGAMGDAPLGETLTDLAEAVRGERATLRGLQDDPDLKARRERAVRALDALAADVETILHADDEMVTWVEQSGSQPALRVAPIDVGGESRGGVVVGHADPDLGDHPARLPQVATRLAQGAGRLIRNNTDRGLVAVLDRRLAQSSYRPFLLAALPPMRRTRERADVTAFFAATGG